MSLQEKYNNVLYYYKLEWERKERISGSRGNKSERQRMQSENRKERKTIGGNKVERGYFVHHISDIGIEGR